jgi:hypothetical protein
MLGASLSQRDLPGFGLSPTIERIAVAVGCFSDLASTRSAGVTAFSGSRSPALPRHPARRAARPAATPA